MDTVFWMFPDVPTVTLKIRIYLSSFSRIGTHIWANIRIEAWKSKNSSDFNIRSSEESYYAR